MKSLKPSHREKKRYLLIKGKNADKKTIENIILEFIGILGYAETSPKIIKQSKDKIILAINRDSLNKIRASFIMSNSDLEIIQVSGALNKLKI